MRRIVRWRYKAVKSAYRRGELDVRPGQGQADVGESGGVRRIGNPMYVKISMLFGNRRPPGPKTGGGQVVVYAPLRVYIALVFFLIFFASIAQASPISDREFGSDDYQLTLAIVARACPRVAQEHLHEREMLCVCARELHAQIAELCRSGRGNAYACDAESAACRGAH